MNYILQVIHIQCLKRMESSWFIHSLLWISVDEDFSCNKRSQKFVHRNYKILTYRRNRCAFPWITHLHNILKWSGYSMCNRRSQFFSSVCVYFRIKKIHVHWFKKHPFQVYWLHIEKFIEDLESVRRYFGIDRLNLLGHSWGAILGAL
jgi:hypothetical protein